MEIEYSEKGIKFEKELNSLDKFTIEFTTILNKLNITYSIVAGYIAILFGRSRSSEDIDIIVGKLSFEKFQELWKELYNSFECINSEDPREAYSDYLLKGIAIRFSKKDKFIPNIEVKFAKVELDFWTLRNKKEVIVNNNKLFISPLELQIPFKLLLGKGGNEKDIEDAKYLYELFKDKIDLGILEQFNRKLNIEELFNRYLK